MNNTATTPTPDGSAQSPSSPIPQRLTPLANNYAALLIGAGFTVYLDARPDKRAGGAPILVGWFHYSRDVTVDDPDAGQAGNGSKTACFGTFQAGDGHRGAETMFSSPEHHMPIQPSRQDGSGIIVSDRSLVGLDVLSVMYATVIASPWNIGQVRDQRGRRFQNFAPWGVPGTSEGRRADGTPATPHYLPAHVVDGVVTL